jgi:hypothetical protein
MLCLLLVGVMCTLATPSYSNSYSQSNNYGTPSLPAPTCSSILCNPITVGFEYYTGFVEYSYGEAQLFSGSIAVGSLYYASEYGQTNDIEEDTYLEDTSTHTYEDLTHSYDYVSMVFSCLNSAGNLVYVPINFEGGFEHLDDTGDAPPYVPPSVFAITAMGGLAPFMYGTVILTQTGNYDGDVWNMDFIITDSYGNPYCPDETTYIRPDAALGAQDVSVDELNGPVYVSGQGPTTASTQSYTQPYQQSYQQPYQQPYQQYYQQPYQQSYQQPYQQSYF